MGYPTVWSPVTGDLVLTPALLQSIIGADAPTGVTATVGTVLTAAAISSGLINRTGPTGAFTDTTDTAAALAALNVKGGSFYVDIKNATPFAQTLANGTGVTFSSSNVVPANSVAEYLCTVNAAGTAVVFNHVFTTSINDFGPIIATALNTVGAATLAAASIAGGVTLRGGAQVAAFTDTTDTAAAIIAAQPNVHVGQSWLYTYFNGTAFPATLTNGIGVTITGSPVVQPGGFAQFLATYTAAGAISLQQIGASANLPPAQFKTAALSVGTLAAGAITGAADVVYQNTGATPGAQTVRTAAQMLADFPGAYVGMSYKLRIVNTGAGTMTLTADGGATVTITGTATIAQNTFRDYIVTFNTATTATIQSVGSGVSP